MVKTESVRKTIEQLSSFHNRYYRSETGKDAATYIFNRFKELAKGDPNIEVNFFPNTFLQPSVIARIKGKDKVKSSEVVVIGGHEDSVAGSGLTARAPGADDDGSGTSTVLEVFKVLTEANFQPDRTVEFHTYAGEEAGLLGSQAIANSYKSKGINVYSMMQFDMTGYVKPGTTPAIGLIHDFVNPELTKFVGLLINAYCDIAWVETKCGYACSDHASWNRAGYASSFPFESKFSDLNPNIHTASDTLQWLSMDHSVEFAKLGVAYVVELSLTN